MKEKIEQIRTLLLQLENEASQAEQAGEFRALSGLELPDIICDVVDLLMPELRPYESVVYMYLLRRSIIQEGSPYVRASIRGLQSAVGQSHRSGTQYRSDNPVESPDYKTVRTAVARLLQIGALRQEGEPNQAGTLYRILLPEEIEVCQQRRAKTAMLPVMTATEREADSYNIRENRLKIYERDNHHCTYCGKQLTRFTATLDHITPVSAGGDNSAENLKTACLQCNSRKTARPLGDFLVARDSA